MSRRQPKSSLSIAALALAIGLAACVNVNPLDPSQPSASASRPVPTATVPAPTPTPSEPLLSQECLAGSNTSANPRVVSTAENPRLVAPAGLEPPATYTPKPSIVALELETELRSLLGNDVDDFAVIAKDLQTGVSAEINGDSLFYAASIFKVFVMFEVFHQESLGLLSFSDSLVISPYYESFGLGPRSTQLCQELSVAQALQATMSISDNATAVLLQDLVGAGNVNNSLAVLGLTESRLETDDLPLAAHDIALLLEIIGSGQAVSPDASAAMIDLLRMEQVDNGLRAGVPIEIDVAHKTGIWPKARHDVGLVFAPSKTYLVVILSIDGDVALIRQLSEVIYAFFTRQE